MKTFSKRFKTARERRHARLRKKMHGTSERPRLSVFRSTKHIYVQAVDDLNRRTLASACSAIGDGLPSVEGEIAGKSKTAKAVGMLIAARLKEKGIERVIFDRGGYIYHGRIAALADGAREGGLKF